MIRQAEALKGAEIDLTVVGKIVDRKQGAWRPFGQTEKRGHECRLPVIGMYDIGTPAGLQGIGRQLCRGLAEAHETLRIVRPVMPLVVGVGESFTIEKARGIDQQQLEVDRSMCGAQHAHLVAIGERQPAEHAQLFDVAQHPTIGRQYDADVHTQFNQGIRQAEGNVTKTAGLDQRKEFARGKEYAHGYFSSSRNTAPSGGMSTSAEHGRSCQASFRVRTIPALPILLPP